MPLTRNARIAEWTTSLNARRLEGGGDAAQTEPSDEDGRPSADPDIMRRDVARVMAPAVRVTMTDLLPRYDALVTTAMTGPLLDSVSRSRAAW